MFMYIGGLLRRLVRFFERLEDLFDGIIAPLLFSVHRFVNSMENSEVNQESGRASGGD